ncbi:hypothetical protein Dform_00386 [Dehalogenimonas formicexedens]|uniref:Uncharacterized protein n=1 Tax=Dehalogenimonas formicexedens TaxID=1839801 RepID=A0A1P8F5I7_9CHLR|nr:hypothetical protein [Dehalogenimonas formicexedens]APV43744.1 hypothetical protein Dform_00386 [Dehalogenimonas formicexedens]
MTKFVIKILKLIFVVTLLALPIQGFSLSSALKPGDTGYVVIGWNNLGMHCFNPDFSSLAILPPYNTLMAQVIKVGDKPQVVTDGIFVEYTFPDNTYSVKGPGVPNGKPDKTNFWTFAQQLFNLSKPLAPNVGLTGKGLSGTFDVAQDGAYFIAEGIPLTNVRDQDAARLSSYPYQKAQITVRDAKTSSILATLTVVAPVSTELNCAMCHSDDGDATTKYAPAVQPTGKLETNILALHDYLNGIASNNYTSYLAGNPNLAAQTPLLDHQPVLCASCHGDNALGMPEIGQVKNLSNAIHLHHNSGNAPDITFDTAGCYSCHPGESTQCLRDTMSQHYSLNCTDCHNPSGNDVIEPMVAVGQNPMPWLNEPQCSTCHGSAYATNQPLYQQSTGHGGLYCSACHDSPHVIAPSREANDSIKFIQLQGHSGTLSDCTVCHLNKPDAMFIHVKR